MIAAAAVVGMEAEDTDTRMRDEELVVYWGLNKKSHSTVLRLAATQQLLGLTAVALWRRPELLKTTVSSFLPRSSNEVCGREVRGKIQPSVQGRLCAGIRKSSNGQCHRNPNNHENLTRTCSGN